MDPKRNGNYASTSRNLQVSSRRASIESQQEKNLNKFKDTNTIYHKISIDELYVRLNTNDTFGLSRQRAKELLLKDGPNCLTPPAVEPTWLRFLKIMFSGFSLLLWCGGILSIIAHFTMVAVTPAEDQTHDHLYMAGSLIAVVTLTGLFSFYQQQKSNQIMEGFKKMLPLTANVIRDGLLFNIPSEEIVVGDLVEIHSGDRTPADIRLTISNNLKVNNSSLTGESKLQSRGIKCSHDNPLETQNLLFSSSEVVEGNGRGIVIACGDNTMIGKIAGLTSNLKDSPAPIQNEMHKFIKVITIIAFVISTVFFVLAIVQGHTWIDAVLLFIGLAMANVPEGLLVTLTACLTLSAKRMARKNCLVKNLEAIEALGSTTVICSDKTGTLTQNKMFVAHIWFHHVLHEIDMNDLTNLTFDVRGDDFLALMRVASLCSMAEFKATHKDVPIEKREIRGDATERGILRFCEKVFGDGSVLTTRLLHPKIVEIPFNSSTKYQVSVHMTETGYLVAMKGAPEIILDRCDTISINGEPEPIRPYKSLLRRAVLEMGGHGERVIGFCEKLLPHTDFPVGFPFSTSPINFPRSQMTFVGFVSLMDPPRPTVPDAVAKCRSAGIRVCMVTGDHPITAVSIARKVGIISAHNVTAYDLVLKMNRSLTDIALLMDHCTAAVVTGAELRDMTVDDIIDVIAKYEEIVFARTSPQQKLTIVESFQQMGAIVAVTGDGVNDAPALRKANIGIAMGITGTDVAKEAAKMVLLDDNFSSIVNGIEEGRLIFDNLKKSIAYTLTSSTSEIFPFVFHIFLGLPLPFSIIAILWVDIVTDLIPAISLAYERPEADIMKRKPRDTNVDSLVNRRLIMYTYGQVGMIQLFSGMLAYFILFAEYGFFPRQLFGVRDRWASPVINGLVDSYGREWTYKDRQILHKMAITAFFVAIVITQLTDLIICKTRQLSIYRQGMRNMILNASLIMEVMITAVLLYTPGSESIFHLYPLPLHLLVPAIPYAIFVFAYDELRKYLIRKYPGGFMAQETYY